MAAVTGAILAAIVAGAGAAETSSVLGRGRTSIKQQMKFNPTDVMGPFGMFLHDENMMRMTEDPNAEAIRTVLGGANPALLSGGMFNNPGLQDALRVNDMMGAFTGAQGNLGVNMSPSAFGGMFASGDLARGLQSGGVNLLAQSGNVMPLIQQNLGASRALAADFENDLINRVQNKLFAQGRLGTTGGAQQFGETINAIAGQDTQRVLNAQQLGLGQQQFLSGLGMQSIGAGLGAEQQGFNQLLQSITQNQTAGQTRLQNAMGLFGLGRDTFESQFGLGLQGSQGQLSRDQFLAQTMLGLLNAESGRIGATGMGTQALAGLYNNQGGLIAGLAGGLSSGLSGMGGGI